MVTIIKHPPPTITTPPPHIDHDLPLPTTMPSTMMQASKRRDRLRAFHEQQKEEPIRLAPAEEPNSSSPSPPILIEKFESSGNTTSSTTLPPPQTIDVQPRNDEVAKKTSVAPTVKETNGSNNAKTGGIGHSFSTMWENMKRMMGFAPDCLNGGYRSIGSRSCACPQYFEGQFCERIMCTNGGSRVRVAAFGGEEVCKCPHPDYIGGKHCEVVHCQNGGRLLNDGTCHCVDGWYSGQFCQYYTSSWLFAIGTPLLFIAIVVFCCVVCRLDLCAFRRNAPPTARSRHNGRRPPNGRRRQQQNCSSSSGGGGHGHGRPPGAASNRHRRENVPFTSREEPHALQQQSQQNPLNGQQLQQYVLHYEQIPMYNPRLHASSLDKPLEPPPPYEQAVLCPPPNHEPPNYCNPDQGGGEDEARRNGVSGNGAGTHDQRRQNNGEDSNNSSRESSTGEDECSRNESGGHGRGRSRGGT